MHFAGDGVTKYRALVSSQAKQNKQMSVKEITQALAEVAMVVRIRRAPKALIPIQLMHWIPWTAKSDGILFKTTQQGVGDGEQRVAKELDTTPLGQNSPYDMCPIINGTEMKCDVKKLDHLTFNTGVIGRNALRNTKNRLEDLLIRIMSIGADAALEEVSPDELSVGNIRRIKALCETLSAQRAELLASLPIIKPIIDPYSGAEVPQTALQYYKMTQNLGLAVPAVLEPFTAKLEKLLLLDHPYIVSPEQMTNDLNGLRSIFDGIVLIYVDEKLGYYIETDPQNNILFERITRGHPRFRAVLKA